MRIPNSDSVLIILNWPVWHTGVPLVWHCMNYDTSWMMMTQQIEFDWNIWSPDSRILYVINCVKPTFLKWRHFKFQCVKHSEHSKRSIRNTMLLTHSSKKKVYFHILATSSHELIIKLIFDLPKIINSAQLFLGGFVFQLLLLIKSESRQSQMRVKSESDP